MVRTRRWFQTSVLALCLAACWIGCASEPELILSDSPPQMARGRQLVREGRSWIDDGEGMIREGKRMIKEGKSLVDKGEDRVEQGEKVIESVEMLEKAERLRREGRSMQQNLAE